MITASSKKAATLIVNTASRKGRRSFQEAKSLLTEAGFQLTAYPITKPHQLSQEIKKVVSSGVKLLIIGGGDGSISEVVDHLAYKNITLGILPLGTANSFTRSLRIPSSLAEAVAVIAAGKTVRVDLGKINDDYFANAVSIGFATTVAQDIPHRLKRYFGILAYALQAIWNSHKLRPFVATLKDTRETRTLTTYQIVIANGSFYGPASLLPEKRLQSSSVRIFTFKDLRPLQIFKMWLRSLAGKKFSEQEMDQVEITGEAVLKTKPRQKVSIDGEIKAETPIRISTAPAALTVLVPEESNLQP